MTCSLLQKTGSRRPGRRGVAAHREPRRADGRDRNVRDFDRHRRLVEDFQDALDADVAADLLLGGHDDGD